MINGSVILRIKIYIFLVKKYFILEFKAVYFLLTYCNTRHTATQDILQYTYIVDYLTAVSANELLYLHCILIGGFEPPEGIPSRT